jgi:hypothetical protein
MPTRAPFLLLLSCLVAGCNSGSLTPPGPDAGGAGAGGSPATQIPPTPRLPEPDVVPGTFDPSGRKVDVLFLVDNSASMGALQRRLIANFSAFVDALQGLPGGMPDLHIAVVTSDLGAGDNSISGCLNDGDRAVFRHAPGGACTSTTLAAGATFIAHSGGATPMTNFSAPDIASVFGCIAAVGESGCGFEHQLAAVARALGVDGAPAPVENQGFLRPDAALAIVLVTNEDDCSAPITSALYDTTSNLTLMSTIGPPSNFRCNEFGHLCSLNGGAPARPARFSPAPAAMVPRGAGGAGGGNGDAGTGTTDPAQTLTYAAPGAADVCVPAETQGSLVPVADYVRNIKALKTDHARRMIVAALTGPTTPYVVEWRSPSVTDVGLWPQIGHACTTAEGAFADPAVRIQAFARAFGTNGSVFPICDADLSPALSAIATQIGHAIAP